MKISEKKRIRKGILEIANRIKKFGRNKEAIKINVNLVMMGQNAINYKVMKLFSSVIADQELIDLIFQMGLQGCVNQLRITALENEIQL